MIDTRMNVNDSLARKTFLTVDMHNALSELKRSNSPKWGEFSAQEMVEHLLWAMEVSTGKVLAVCKVPFKLLERFKPFLYNDQATSREFMNLMLKQGLPQLRYKGIVEANAALRSEVDTFFAKESSTELQSALRIHPIFGPLTHEEWERSHYKHFFHHLLQFGLAKES
jgi:hypothetical protein